MGPGYRVENSFLRHRALCNTRERKRALSKQPKVGRFSANWFILWSVCKKKNRDIFFTWYWMYIDLFSNKYFSSQMLSLPSNISMSKWGRAGSRGNGELSVVRKGLMNIAKSRGALDSGRVYVPGKALSENEIKTSETRQIEFQLGFRISKRLTTQWQWTEWEPPLQKSLEAKCSKESQSVRALLQHFYSFATAWESCQ